MLLGVVILAALLYYPVYRLILVLSVGRLQKKLGKPLSEEEINGQKRRALFISILLVPVFSYIYNVGINA